MSCHVCHVHVMSCLSWTCVMSCHVCHVHVLSCHAMAGVDLSALLLGSAKNRLCREFNSNASDENAKSLSLGKKFGGIGRSRLSSRAHGT